MSPAPLSEALHALSRFMVAEASLGDTLQRVAEITTGAIPAAEYLGISMLDSRGRATTAIFTDPEAPDIDSAQYGEGNGPCLDSWREKRVVRVDDMDEATDLYPKFARAAMDHGIHSSLSLPIIVGDDGLGAMNLYSKSVKGFTDDDESTGKDLAVAAAVVLANSQSYWQALELAEGLREAMNSRAVIEQAKGILMAKDRDLTPDDAFELLKRASQRENIKLREIAARIVDRRPSTPPRVH